MWSVCTTIFASVRLAHIRRIFKGEEPATLVQLDMGRTSTVSNSPGDSPGPATALP
jgi:hypothetical protein